MSEFPDWVENRIGLYTMTYEQSKELHRQIAAVYELVPDIEERMRSWPDPDWPFWKRYLWYMVHA